ncbi:MAG: sialidase family protein, partial [Thermoplasmatota archaeon]
MRFAPVLLALGLVLAGCLSSPKTPVAPQTTPAPALPPLVVVANDVGAPVNATRLPAVAPPVLPTFIVHDLNVSAEEPTMGVDAKGALYVGSAQITDTPARNIRQPDVMRSMDHGKTWTAMATFPDESPATLDPYLYVDQSTNRLFVDHLYVGCSWLSWSDDQGATWGNDPIACGLPDNDHQTIVAGKPTTGTTVVGSYPNVVYYAYNGNYP